MGPLSAIRILELGFFGAGPMCPRLLASLGAEVLKIEPPLGDPLREMPPLVEGRQHGYPFEHYNAGKKSVGINLKSSGAREVVLDLVRQCDVLVQSFVPGKLEGVGLDYQSVRGANSRLVYCSISGFGTKGPDSHRPALDTSIQAISGVMVINGELDQCPLKLGVSIADSVAPAVAASGIVTALLRREDRGTGGYIDLSMLNSLAWTMQPSIPDAMWKSASPTGASSVERSASPSDPVIRTAAILVECCDGWLIATSDLLSALDLLGRESVVEHVECEGTPTYRKASTRFMVSHVSHIVRGVDFSCEEVADRLCSRSIACHRVLTPTDALASPLASSRGVSSPSIPEWGVDGLVVRTAYGLGSRSEEPLSRAPDNGEHTYSVLTGLLGYDDRLLEQLTTQGVIH